MFFVYVLQSLRNNKRYVGFTRKDPLARLEQHNHKCNTWTRQNGPFKMLFTESYSDQSNALRRERFLKSGQGRKYIDSKLTAPESFAETQLEL